MFEFSGYKQELNNFCIPDMTNIIICYTYGYIDEFTINFIDNCIVDGNYLYYNKNKATLVHYLFDKKRYNDIKILLKNSKYLRAKHFQNKNIYGQTELYWLCYYEMHNTIIQIDGLKAEHFQNKDEDGWTELHRLCYHKMHNTIIQIDGLKAKHFQNKNNNIQTELYWICLNEMHDTIVQIDGLKAKHFQNKNKNGDTELHWLCINNMHNTIIQIDGLKAKHFQNKDNTGRTELYWLCIKKMHDTIKAIGRNFADGFWKLEHCNTDIERQYMKDNILIQK